MRYVYFCECVQRSENTNALYMHASTHTCGCAHVFFWECMCVHVYILADGMLIERPRDGAGRCYNISFFHYLSLLGFVMQMYKRVGDSKCQDFKIFFLSFFQEQSDEVSWLSSMFGTSLLTRLYFVEITFATIIICMSKKVLILHFTIRQIYCIYAVEISVRYAILIYSKHYYRLQ